MRVSITSGFDALPECYVKIILRKCVILDIFILIYATLVYLLIIKT